MEEFILNLLENIAEIDFNFVWQIFLYGLVVFWFVVLYWVWLDSGDRTSRNLARFSYVLLVLIFNIIGLIIYLIIRPNQTIEEIYWIDLERRYLKYETAELGDCPKCGRQLFPGFTFCPNCRHKLKIKCRGCEVFVEKKNKFCPHCGSEIRKRRSPEETSPTKEVMQEQIQSTRNEAVEVVESKKTRYSRSRGFVVRIGESIVGGYKIIFRKSRNFIGRLKERLALRREIKKAKKNKKKVDSEVNENYLPKSKKQEGKKKKKKSKKKKKKRSKSHKK